MRLAHRLVLGSSAVVATVMTIYGMNVLRQRERLIGIALARETETLANTMQIVANSAIRNQQTPALDRVLSRILGDPEIAIAAVLDSTGAVMAGGPADGLACVRALAARAPGLGERRLWADCGGRVRLVMLPLRPPARVLVVARRTTVMDRDIAASARWILLTSVALAVLGSLAIVGVVRRWLTRPMAGILSAVSRLGGPALPGPIRLDGAAAELEQLASAFNAMVARLDGNQQSLFREVEERIALERRLRRAESFAALGRLTGGVAHELGSPLGVIRVRAEAIHDSADATPAVRRHAAAIAAELERIERLIRDLVHVARRHGPEGVPTGLAGVVGTVTDALAPELAAHQIDLAVTGAEAGITVAADPLLLHHALYAVVLNAVQALSRHPGERTIRVTLSRAGGMGRVEVEDTGPGIDPELLPSVFEPFFTTKDVGEGSGLGLAISAGIIEEHAGRLSLAPAPGGGVRAEIEIPLAEPETGPR